MTNLLEDKITLTSKQNIKCVIWDLDNTIWEGVLLEDIDVQLYPHIKELIENLDNRGILQSIASRNEYELAINKLKEFGIDEYFIYPQINWNDKSNSVQKIVESINVGMDTIAFIDDQAFEREEVNYKYPEVLCIDAVDSANILEMSVFNPTFITDDSRKRRKMYMNDIIRQNVEDSFDGPQEEFLTSLEMVMTIKNVEEDDLKRAEELTVRTNQLNATGYTYSYDELDSFRHSDKYKLLITDLEDKYGEYGKIGLSLLECEGEVWTLKLLLMSCRVVSRGVGSVMLNYIAKLANDANKILRAEFVTTDRNRMMLLTYKFAGFKEVEQKQGITIFEYDFSEMREIPNYLTLKD